MYIIISHYSNENIGEFDTIGVHPNAYPTLDAAKKAADELFRADRENGIERTGMVSVSSEDGSWSGLPFDDPSAVEYCVGEALEDDFDVYHNVYAVFKVVPSA